jgi:small subunit ribosomal protein S1
VNDETMNTQEAVDAPVAPSAEVEISTPVVITTVEALTPIETVASTTLPQVATPEVASVDSDSVAQAPEDPLAAIKPRTQFKGKVMRTDLGGAFIDIGVGVLGHVHISQIASDQPVTRVADVLKVGDEVDVYIGRVNAARKRIDLTMIKPATFDWDNLSVGAKLTDVKVVAVESFGAFVDIDGPKHGLVPFNLMPRGDRPKVGDTIETVWVIEVSADKRRIGLTMVEPPALSWESIHRGDKFTGKVTRIERNGAYVDIGAEREGLIRTSSLGAGFVNMSTVVNIGEDVPVRVVKVDSQKRQIDLSLEGISTEEFSLSSGPDEVISPFAVAMQRAQKVKKAQDRMAAAAANAAKNN